MNGFIAEYRMEIWLERSIRQHDLRVQKLAEKQNVLLDAQNSTWAAVNTLTANIEKLTRGRGSNGQGE